LTLDNDRSHLHRKRFLVKPALQLKSLGFIILIVLLSSAGIYLMFETTLWNSLVLVPLTEAQTASLTLNLRLSFYFMLMILLAACGLESYLFFHRIVGPLFALERELKRVAQGDLQHETHLRAGDELKDVFETLGEVKKSLRERVAQEAQLLEKCASIVEQMAREHHVRDPQAAELRKNIQALRETASRIQSKT
jgi:methyl-accepting chemotaxis protein